MPRFFDTNILIYALADDERSEVAARLLADGGLISVQSLAEFTYVARRKLRFTWDQIRAAIEQFQATCDMAGATPIERFERALTLAERFKLNIHDATLIATALDAGCEEFLSEDMQDGMVIDGRMTIRNPFAAA